MVVTVEHGQGAMCWEATWIELDALNTVSESIKESYSGAEDMTTWPGFSTETHG